MQSIETVLSLQISVNLRALKVKPISNVFYTGIKICVLQVQTSVFCEAS